ncbi:MAG: hypothetical protein KF773_07915 [Deltaproteobacteria bacterium]|nr:hypothetical protein [Deltaproteobacteria bacterium]
MRVTGNHLIELTTAATARQQGKLASAAEQVTSGLRVTSPSDDPSAWLTAQRAKLQRTVAAGASVAVQASRDRLDETDGALSTIGDAVSQVRALAIQANTGTLSASDRAALVDQVRGLQALALGAANRRDVNGEYLFAGANALNAPFDAAGAYAGDGAVRQVPDGLAGLAATTIPGSALTAAHGVDVLPLFGRIADALAANDTAALAAALPDLTTAVGQVAEARSRTGSTMAVLDGTLRAHGALADSLTTAIARAVEVDTVAAAGDLAKTSQALEVSRAVSAHVISLLSPST